VEVHRTLTTRYGLGKNDLAMTHICLWGTTMGKVADEAQFLAILRLIEQVAPEATVTILARPAPQTAGTEASRPARIIPTYRLDLVVPTIARADLLIMVGGCFMEVPRQGAVCAGLESVAKVCRTPVVGVGVTAFPYHRPWAQKLYRRVFNGMEVISVREPSAGKALADLSIRTEISQRADPRFVLGTATTLSASTLLERFGLLSDRPVVGVTLRYLHDLMPDWVKRAHDYTPAAADRVNTAIANALDALAQVAQLVLLPMHTSLDEDRTAAALITSQMRAPQALKVDLPQLRLPELLALISHCDLIMANRLAAGMFAVSTATPAISVAYEHRLIDLMTTLGLEEYVLPWRSADEEKLPAIATRAWTQRLAIRDRIKAARRPLLESAWSNADMIAPYVN
jgi:polysaccharide pyruvyl transferase WcaK-like protein